jgi:hypothetical protein
MPQQIFIWNSITWMLWNQNQKRTQRRRDAKITQSFFFAFLRAFASLRECFCFFCKAFTFNRMTWLGIAVLFVAAPIQAGETVPYTLAQRTQKAEVIVVAEVTSISSAWNDQESLIFTYTELRILEKIKGTFQNDKIVLKHLGGAVGNVEYHVSGVPQFSRHERVLLFLGRIPNSSYFGVMDWLEGKKTIQNDAAGQQMIRVGATGEKSQALKEYLNEIQSLLKQK